jgi:ankyrin repeat protein
VETYNRALRKIHIKKPATTLFVQKIFKWITCARRPLAIDEIKEAISISPGDKNLNSDNITTDDSRIIQACANLVVFDSDDRTIRFAHYSVKEFLLCAPNHDESISNVHFQLVDAEREAGEICVTYLSFQSFGMQVARTTTHDPNTSNWDLNLLNSSFLFGNSYLGWFGSAIISGWARFRGYKKTQSGSKIDWNEYLRKAPSQPPKSELFQKYRLLNYVIENWADHTIGFSDTDKLWLNFESLALEKELSFSFRPWGDIITIKSLPYMPMVLWATEKGHGPLLKLLLSPPRGPSLSVYLDQKMEEDLKLSVAALHRSVITGQDTCTKLLLDNTRFEPIYLNSALDLAVNSRHGPIIHLLLDHGGKPYSLITNDTTRALHIAARQGDDIIVAYLLERGDGIDIIDEDGSTALHWAADKGHDKVVQCLLDGGAGIDIATKVDGLTALHWAADKGHDKVVQCLLDRGAGIDITTEQGSAALHLAAESGHDKVVQCLLDGGAGIDIATKAVGWTALHWAANEGHDKVVQCLLDRGAGIDITTEQGSAALHLAAESGHDKVVQCLLDGGAREDITNRYGYTAPKLANQMINPKIIRSLQKGRIDTGQEEDSDSDSYYDFDPNPETS